MPLVLNINRQPYSAVHMTLPELQLAPAPFLNRFEKYRVTHAHLLESHLRQKTAKEEEESAAASGGVTELGRFDRNIDANEGKSSRSRGAAEDAVKPDSSSSLRLHCKVVEILQTAKLTKHVIRLVVGAVGVRGVYGFAPDQTVESALLRLVSGWKREEDAAAMIAHHLDSDAFRATVDAELASRDAIGAQSARGTSGGVSLVCASLRGDAARIADILRAPQTDFERDAVGQRCSLNTSGCMIPPRVESKLMFSTP